MARGLLSLSLLCGLVLVSRANQHALKRLHDLLAGMRLDPVVDANVSAMHNVFHPGNSCPFQRKIMSKLANAQPIKIEILGGSATFGADLKNKEAERWSTRLASVMNGGWTNSSISVTNRAIPACNVDSWIYLYQRFKDADLVIVDLSVNDQGFDLPVLSLYYKTLVQLLDEMPNHPAIMFVQMFRTALQSKKEIDGVCPDPEKHGHCCNDVWWCKKWWDMQDYVTAPVLDKFRVPYVSYRDLVWPVYSQPPAQLSQFWNGYSHPDVKNHALIGKLVAYGVLRMFMQAHMHDFAKCRAEPGADRYVFGEDADKSVTGGLCRTPLSQMFANDSAASEQSFVLSSTATAQHAPEWRFYNDSKQKYGWILQVSPEAVVKIATPASTTLDILTRTRISFDVNFGAEPILQVTYLKSWSEDMGTALLWVDDKINDTVALPGYWKDEYSVSHYTTITPRKMANVSLVLLGENFILPSLTPGKHVVHIAAASLTDASFFTHGTTIMASKKNKGGFKWKLIGITSC